MEISLRINELIIALGYNKSSFAYKIGVSQPSISYIISGRNSPGLKLIQSILFNFPEISSEWLIMGRGKMILNN